MKKLHGIAASSGCIMGVVNVRAPIRIQVEKRTVDDFAQEVETYHRVRSAYLERLAELGKKMPAAENAAAGIFSAYEEIIQDDAFFSVVLSRTMEEKINIDYVIEEEKQKTIALFASLDDEYLRERAADIANVCNELILGIQGKTSHFAVPVPSGEKIIVCAEDLTPEDTMKIDKRSLGGFVTEKGGLTSHTVILARMLGIPAVVGVKGLLAHVENGMQAIIYGDRGEVLLAPDASEITVYKHEKEEERRIRAEYEKAKALPAVTTDGIQVNVPINCGDMSETVDLTGCDGVGLFRTEFIYMCENEYPSEEKQFGIYKSMAEQAGGKELIIRTLDIGGDKQAAYMSLPAEANPFLGYRAIRLCLDRTDVFKTQLRAILRASVFGDVKVMFPMIVSLEELDCAKGLLAEAMDELLAEKIAFNERIPIGVMIETPASVWLSDDLARRVDFFSIGTNDLIQYTTATDRMNEKIQYLYECCSPSVLRSIRHVCRSAQKHRIAVGMCGEAASDPLLIPLWVGMGIRELSVVPSNVARTKYILGRISRHHMEERVKTVLQQGYCAEIKASLQEILSMITV